MSSVHIWIEGTNLARYISTCANGKRLDVIFYPHEWKENKSDTIFASMYTNIK